MGQIDQKIELDDPEQVISRLAQHLRTFGFPPDRQFKSIFVFTFQIWSSSSNLAFGRWAGEVINAIHSLPDQADNILTVYLEVARDPALNVDADLLQSSYLKFRRLAKRKFSSEPPISLVEHTIGGVSNDVEKAFEWFGKWETAFDGVRLLWNTVLNDPECDFKIQFDKLLYSQKQFVIQGFKVSNSEQDGGASDRITKLIAELERRAPIPPIKVEDEVEKVAAKAREASGLSKSARSPRSRRGYGRRGVGRPSDDATRP
jgi:hypothetical protein